jgi:hypothetical protein
MKWNKENCRFTLVIAFNCGRRLEGTLDPIPGTPVWFR